MNYWIVFVLCGLFALLLFGCTGQNGATNGQSGQSAINVNYGNGSAPPTVADQGTGNGSGLSSINDAEISPTGQNDSNLISSQDIIEPG